MNSISRLDALKALKAIEKQGHPDYAAPFENAVIDALFKELDCRHIKNDIDLNESAFASYTKIITSNQDIK